MYDLCISLDKNTREIYLFGDEENSIDHRIAFIFLQYMAELENKSDRIIIHANTVGGNWWDGLVIFDAIANSHCHITYVIHGQAFSMGSILPQAADERIMMPNSIMMIHPITPGLSDNLTAKQAAESIVIDKYVSSIMLDIYANKCSEAQYFKDLKYSLSRIKNFIRNKLNSKHDWWLKPGEAILYGFADSILGTKYSDLRKLRSNT